MFATIGGLCDTAAMTDGNTFKVGGEARQVTINADHLGADLRGGVAYVIAIRATHDAGGAKRLGACRAGNTGLAGAECADAGRGNRRRTLINLGVRCRRYRHAAGWV